MILSASARLCRQFRLHAGGDARFRPLGGRGVRPAARCIGGGGAGAALVAFAFKCNLAAFFACVGFRALLSWYPLAIYY